MSRFVTIARILKTRGISGEVAAEILTDFPDRFSTLSEVRLSHAQSVYHERIENYWFHKNRIILKFQGRDTPEAAQELIGSQLQIREDERVGLPAGTFFDSDLEGCSVFEKGSRIGTVKEVFKAGGNETASLVIHTFTGLEMMLPAVKAFIQRVDIAQKRIDVLIPDGLVETASPIEK